jgi:hypothetical protein
MKSRIVLLLAMVVAVSLTGCAFGPERDINDPTNSLVFGYIDMSDAPTKAKRAWVRQVAPPAKKPYWELGVIKGAFYNVYLPPGSYQISRFYGSGFFKGEYNYDFPRQGNETSVRINKPGIYFLGAYKYKRKKTGFFQADAFTIEKVSAPTEAQLLQRLLDDDRKLRESAWGEKIRAHIGQRKS